MYCPKCGQKNEDSAKFCMSCGQALSQDAADSPWQLAGDISDKEHQTLSNAPVQPVCSPSANAEWHSIAPTVDEHTTEGKRKGRFLKIMLPIISIVGILIIAFFAVRAAQPWFSIDNGKLCFHETTWKIFDFGFFKDSLTLPHDSTGWNGEIDDDFLKAMDNFREFKYDGTAQELCENNSWVIYCLYQRNYWRGDATICCDDFNIVRMMAGAVQIASSSPYDQKEIGYDPFYGEPKEYTALFIETMYVVYDKDGDALCGFDIPGDLIYWAQTGIARPIYSSNG